MTDKKGKNVVLVCDKPNKNGDIYPVEVVMLMEVIFTQRDTTRIVSRSTRCALDLRK